MAASRPPVLVVEPPSLKTLDLFYPPWTRMSHLIAMHLCLCLLPEMGPLSMEAPGLWLPFQEELLCGMGQLSLSYPELHQSLLKRIQRSTPPPLLRDVDTVTRELERLPPRSQSWHATVQHWLWTCKVTRASGQVRRIYLQAGTMVALSVSTALFSASANAYGLCDLRSKSSLRKSVLNGTTKAVCTLYR